MKAAIKWLILIGILMTVVGGLLWVSVVAISCWGSGGSITLNGGCWHNFWFDTVF